MILPCFVFPTRSTAATDQTIPACFRNIYICMSHACAGAPPCSHTLPFARDVSQSMKAM